MKQFLKKYQSRIIFWGILILIVVYLAPRQRNFYLNEDIEYFETKYLTPILIGVWIFVSALFLIFLLVKVRPLVNAFYTTLYISVFVAFFLFIFQDLFLAGSLFINRQFKRESITKTYLASYLYGTDINKSNFFPYDISSKHISIDSKLKEQLYYPELKQNDTIILQLEKGLWGIPYQSKPFKEK